MSPSSRPRARKGEGDRLREEILRATERLLIKTGDQEAVSIRAIAQAVGVTPPSIYLHFADKDALLEAVCARYFEALHDEMQQAAQDQPTTLAALRAQGLAYVRFATATPELYRIATMGEGRQGSDVDATLNSSAFAHLRGSVETLMAEGLYPSGDPTPLTLELWAAAHGVAAMLIAKPYLPFGDATAFADNVLRAVCTGHMTLGIVGPDAGPEEMISWLFDNKGVHR